MDGNKQEIAQWVHRLQNGDMQAFNSLYAVTNDSGYFTALKILKDPDEAQDVLQESYIAVLEKIGDLQSPETFVSWFHQIVANRAKNALVKKKPALFQTQEQEQAYTDFVPDEDEAFQPQASVDQADLRDQVMQIVDGLSDDKRACVLLFYYNELSIADIAATMDVPENTVKTRLFQARKDIRKGVEALQKKNVCLRSAAPVSLVIWALRMAQKSEGGAFSAGPAAALVLQEVTAASAGTAAAGAAQAATAGTFVAKLTAMTAAQKVIAGVVAAGIVTGAAAGTTAVVRNRETPAEPAAQAVVSMTEPAATVPQTWETLRDIALTETQTAQVQTETAATSRREETQSTTVSQTAAKETASTAGSTTVRVTGFTVPSTASTTKAQTSATTAPTTTQRATTTTQKVSETTTSAPTANTPALTPVPTTTTTTAAPTTTTTTTKPKGTATVTVQYSVADYGDSGAVTFTVEEGSAITTDMVIAAVRSKLEPTYGSGIEVFLRSGSAVAAAQPTAYSYEVLVYAD